MFHKMSVAVGGIAFGALIFALVSLFFSVAFMLEISQELPVFGMIPMVALAFAMWVIEMSLPAFVRTSSREKSFVLLIIWGSCAAYSLASGQISMSNFVDSVEAEMRVKSDEYKLALAAREKANEAAGQNAVSQYELSRAQIEVEAAKQSLNSLLNSTTQNSNGVNVSVSSILSSCDNTRHYTAICNQVTQLESDISRYEATIARYSLYQSKLAHAEALEAKPLPGNGLIGSQIAGLKLLAQEIGASYDTVKFSILLFLSFLSVLLPALLTWMLGRELGLSRDQWEAELNVPIQQQPAQVQHEPEPEPAFKRSGTDDEVLRQVSELSVQYQALSAQTERQIKQVKDEAYHEKMRAQRKAREAEMKAAAEAKAKAAAQQQARDMAERMRLAQAREAEMAEKMKQLEAQATTQRAKPKLKKQPTKRRNTSIDDEIYPRLVHAVKTQDITNVSTHWIRHFENRNLNIKVAQRLQLRLLKEGVIKKMGHTGRGELYKAT